MKCTSEKIYKQEPGAMGRDMGAKYLGEHRRIDDRKMMWWSCVERQRQILCVSCIVVSWSVWLFAGVMYATLYVGFLTSRCICLSVPVCMWAGWDWLPAYLPPAAAHTPIERWTASLLASHGTDAKARKFCCNRDGVIEDKVPVIRFVSYESIFPVEGDAYLLVLVLVVAWIGATISKAAIKILERQSQRRELLARGSCLGTQRNGHHAGQYGGRPSQLVCACSDMRVHAIFTMIQALPVLSFPMTYFSISLQAPPLCSWAAKSYDASWPPSYVCEYDH